LFADLRYAFRVLSRTPSFAVAVVSVLALGIGANTAIFSIVNAVLLRPLPFEEPERLVRIHTVPPGGTPDDLSPGKFYDWQRSAQSFEGMGLYQCCGLKELALTGTGTARMVRGIAVSAGFFEVVRARPALGRVFRQEEDTPGGKHVVILSDRFWKAEFGGQQDVIGRTLKLNDESYTIVGVMPATASIASWPVMASDVWVPLGLTAEQRADRGNNNREGVARLKRNVELAQSQAEMDAISDRRAREFPETDGGGWGAAVIPLQEGIVGNSRTMLLLLLGAVGLVLLIACANVSNLLFTRAVSRRKEIAVRFALGAARGRVFQQLLIEALLLATAGGVLGLLLAYGALASASTLLAGQVPRADEISIDGRVLLFAMGVSMLTGVLAGTLPGVRASQLDLNDAVKDGGRSNGAIGVGTRRVLIVCEVALSLVLLAGAGVMIQSLLALRSVDAGFDPNNVLTLRVRLIDARYSGPQRSAFVEAALQRIRALPGVVAAGSIDTLPFTGGGSAQILGLEGRGPRRDAPVVQVREISPGYVRAMGIPVLRGRDVADSDGDVLLISEATAKLYWGADDPIGRRARLPALSRTLHHEVVGIVGDVKHRNLIEGAIATPTVYFYTSDSSVKKTFTIRTSVPPASLVQSAVAAIHAIDPEQPVAEIQTMVQVLDQKMTPQRISARFLGVFAGVALLLAAVGIYSVLSYIVRGRSREIGIRTALGARRADVLRLVIVEGMAPALVGIAAGSIAALASARVMKTLVFGVSASDSLTLVAVGIILACVAFVASLVPASRALRLDPMKVLRAE